MNRVSIFRKIFRLLKLIPQQKKVNLLFLIFSIIFSSLVEVFSVYLIIPTYRSIVDNQPISESIPSLSRIINNSFDSQAQEKLIVLTFFAFVFVIGNILKGLVIWNSSLFTANISVFLFSSAYSKVLFKPYEKLFNANISRFSSNFNTTNSYFVKVLELSIILFGNLLTSLFLISTLLLVKPKVTIFGLLFMAIPYLILSKLTSPFLERISTQQGVLHEEINRNIQEGFKSLKTIKHFRVFDYYINIFNKKELRLRRISAYAEFINTSPKLILEALGVCLFTLLFGISYFLKSITIPYIYIITLAFAAQKMLPTLQQIFRIWAFIRAHKSSVDDLYNIFFSEKKLFRKKFKFEKNAIIFKNIFYKYPKDEKYVLSNLNLKIDFPNSVFISGSSGCGKTTLVDLMTGLIYPSKGSIIYPNALKENKFIGYVPQEIPIINGSILDNIYLGDMKLKKDNPYLEKCIEIVELKKFIRSLPAGLNTVLGEQSINLSGGQKQRLGILRALIRNPKILIMDESTNAIDKNCEEKIINNLLLEFKDSLIIMISHDQDISKKFNVNLNFDEKSKLLDIRKSS